jgi:biotin operon repressor
MYDKFLELIKDKPIPATEIEKTLSISRQHIYGLANGLRKKGHNIKCTKRGYQLIHSKAKVTTKEETKIENKLWIDDTHRDLGQKHFFYGEALKAYEAAHRYAYGGHKHA